MEANPTPLARRPGRTGGVRAPLATLCLLLALAVLLPPDAGACVGTPPPPFCGKTLVISQALPETILLPGGGTFDVPVLLYFNLVDWPPGTGICPGGPYAVDVALTTSCAPGPDGAGGLLGEPILPGFNDFVVPLTVPAGPPRRCVVTATATTTLADGMELTADSDTVVCLAEPAPDDPLVPRLDLRLRGRDTGPAIQRVHPGDQAAWVYEVVNNDPTRTFEGLFGIEMKSTSRLPAVAGPMPPGTGPFSVADPGMGDNPRVAKKSDLVDGCIQLSPDTLFQAPSITGRPVRLGPGESQRLPFFARPWGMCPTGTCGRALVELSGAFNDASPGLACAGAVVAADAAVPPTYSWPGSGQTAQVLSPANPTIPRLELEGTPKPDGPTRGADSQLTALGVFEFPPEAPLEVECNSPNLFSSPFGLPERGRMQIQCGGEFQVDSFFDVIFRIDVEPLPSQPIQPEIVSMSLTGGPTGFELQAPAAEALVALKDDATFQIDSFFDVTYQVQVVGVDGTTGERRPLGFSEVFLDLGSDHFLFFLIEGQLEPPGLGSLDALEIDIDAHGFLSEAPPTEELIFTDGFESGDLAAWSRTVP